MRNKTGLFILMMLTVTLASGCAAFHKATESVEVHDQVLVYELPYDLTYLRAMDAVTFIPNWTLLQTEKEKGLILLDNTNFKSMTDADKRRATLLVKRVDRKHTSVELAPFSQQVLGGDKLLATIDQLISKELVQ